MQIADIHTHIFPGKIAEKASAAIGDFYNTPHMELATLENLMAQEEKVGVSYVAVSSSATSPEQASHINDFIIRSVESRPNLIPFGSLFPTMEHWEPELERIVAMGIRGIKIHPDFQKIDIDDPKAVPMYRAISKAGIPVLFHTGDHRYDYSAPERLINLIRQVPDLVAIAAHFGGWQAWDRAYKYVMPENVFYDTSSSLMFLGKERALDYLEKMGPQRFLYGTDFPMWKPEEELVRFLDLGLDESTRDRILFGNFTALFLN